MQQANNQQQGTDMAGNALPSYADTLGFNIIQKHDPKDLPEDVRAEVRDTMAALTAINPDDIESAVVVIRAKQQGPDGQPGFNLVVAAVGPNQLVLGSAMMLQEHLANEMGGPGAMLAAVLGGVAGKGCDDPNCETCGNGCGEVKQEAQNDAAQGSAGQHASAGVSADAAAESSTKH